jgi:glutathione synthase/RimK-type ligase-like ATP-grasp enzyme
VNNATIQPEILIISNKHDYSTDHVTFQLNRLEASYLRLNRDQFPDFEISLFPTEQELLGRVENFSFQISPEKLKSVYFRAPVYLHANYQPGISPDDQLARSQWAAFVRAISVFDNVLWINDPQATYKAEIKPYQLYLAKKVGFALPKTIVTNAKPHPNTFEKSDRLIIKTLDPAILNLATQEAFIYTNFIDYDELKNVNLSSAPVIIQEAIVPKIDIRVTVVGEKAFPVAIKKHDHGIDRDWRLEKDEVEYTRTKLPPRVQEMCISLTKKLGLQFSGIDLALKGGEYYFLEINPTGEWAWLIEHTKWPIDEEIAKLLMKG